MTFSKVIFYCCFGFLFGVFVASFIALNFIFYFLFLISALIILTVFYKRKICVIGLCALAFLFGIFWEERFEAEIVPQKEDIHYYNEKGEFIVEGIITKELQEKEKSVEATVKVKRVNNKFVNGNLLIFLEPGSDIKYGDKVLLKGKIKEPKNFTPDFNYKEYLRAKRIYSVMFYPEIKILERNKGNPILAKIFSFKEKLKKRAKILPPPEGAILSAIVLGDKSRISNELKERLSITGLSHIVAISGMHIMIILEIFFLTFIWIGFWRREATIFSLLILFFYILLIGAPPSAIRAGIMGAILYVGWTIGRLTQSTRSLVFAATAMVLLNPLILTRDVGFQLSFLATIGIIYFYPIFEEKLSAKNSKLKQLICLTFSAQILCLPILIFNFGNIPIFAPIANIFVVPLLPFLIISGFSFLIITFFSSSFAYYLSFFLKVGFSFVIFVINKISLISFASFTPKIPYFILFLFYFLVFLALLFVKSKNLEIVYEKGN